MARTRMATLQRSATLAALLLASAFCLARGTITASHVRSDDRQLIPLSQGFGFAVSPEECVDSSSVPCPGGHVHLELSNLTVHLGQNASKNTDLNRMGFFVSDVEPTDMLDALAMAGGACVLDHDLVPSTSVLIRLSDSRIRPSLQSGKPASTSWTQRITDSFDDVPYLYLYVYFGNCEPTPVSFDMNIKMYNIDSKGKINYLSVGDSALGIVYWVSAVGHGTQTAQVVRAQPTAQGQQLLLLSAAYAPPGHVQLLYSHNGRLVCAHLQEQVTHAAHPPSDGCTGRLQGIDAHDAGRWVRRKAANPVQT